MKKFLTYIAIVVLVVGGGLAAFWPVNHWRLYDANLNPLSLTEAEAWCTGNIGLDSGFKQYDDDVATCVKASELGAEPSVADAPRWFCEGIKAAGWPYSTTDCLGILDGQDLWPLLEGGLTWEWNAAHPRPAVVAQQITEPARAGQRDTDSRGSGIAPNIDEESEGTSE